MNLSSAVIVLAIAGLLLPAAGGPPPGPDGPGDLVIAATSETFTQCEPVVVRATAIRDTELGYPPRLLVFTADGTPVKMARGALPDVTWKLPAGDSADFPWDQRYELWDDSGLPIPPSGDPVPTGEYYAALTTSGSDEVGNAPFTIVPCLALDAGADRALLEGESATLHATVGLGANDSLLGLTWDLDASVDADGNGDAADDADAVGQDAAVVFGDDGEFNVTATARVSRASVTTGKVDQDVLFLIDSSGSMVWNDPGRDRLTASKGYVDRLSPDDRAAVIDFDLDAFLVPDPDTRNPGDHLSLDYANVKTNIGRVDSSGGTAFSPAFRIANKEFDRFGNDAHTWVILFLTDAESVSFHDKIDFPGVFNETVGLGVKVFPIGLNVPDELDPFMQDLANRTGGQYFSGGPSEMAGIYESIASTVENATETIEVLTDTLHVSVANVAPAIGPVNVTVTGEADLVLRVAGEKFHDVTATLTCGGNITSTATIVRTRGSPDAQSKSLGTVSPTLGRCDAEVVYTPLDDPVNGQVWGATPAWLILAQDGNETRLHHTFNVRHADTWVWTVEDLGPYVAPAGVELRFTATDPGSDDLAVTVDWGDGTIDTFLFPNNVSVVPDPDPSIEVNPRAITATATHAYPAAGTYTITVTVADDDGGVATASLSVAL